MMNFDKPMNMVVFKGAGDYTTVCDVHSDLIMLLIMNAEEKGYKCFLTSMDGETWPQGNTTKYDIELFYEELNEEKKEFFEKL